jgi:hypothetical protein
MPVCSMYQLDMNSVRRRCAARTKDERAKMLDIISVPDLKF